MARRSREAAKAACVRATAIVLITVPLAAQRTPATGARAVASVKQLHEVMISPASDAAALAATAAERKDGKALEAATDSITVACETCHRPYRDQGRRMGVPAK